MFKFALGLEIGSMVPCDELQMVDLILFLFVGLHSQRQSAPNG